MGPARGERRSDRAADELALNQWALAGEWSVSEEAAALEAPPGAIAYRFQARDVNLVLAPPASGAAVRFTVRLDGRPPGDAHGVDVDASGDGVVSNRGCISWSASQERSPSASSRSPSSTPACARTCSRSANPSRRPA